MVRIFAAIVAVSTALSPVRARSSIGMECRPRLVADIEPAHLRDFCGEGIHCPVTSLRELIVTPHPAVHPTTCRVGVTPEMTLSRGLTRDG
jgi:hypothetical protein